MHFFKRLPQCDLLNLYQQMLTLLLYQLFDFPCQNGIFKSFTFLFCLRFVTLCIFNILRSFSSFNLGRRIN